MYCPNCGNELGDAEGVCSKCGYEVVGSNDAPKAAKIRSRLPIIAAMVLAGVVCIVLGALAGRAALTHRGSVAPPNGEQVNKKEGESITPLSMIRDEAHVWYLTRALNEPGKDVAYALYIFGDGGAYEIVDAIDYGGERSGSYLNVGTFGAIDGYSDEDLVANLSDFQDSAEDAQGYCMSGQVNVDPVKDKASNAVTSEVIWLKDSEGQRVGDFEIVGVADTVFQVGSWYYAGFKCTHGQYLVRRFEKRDEVASVVFALDTDIDNTCSFTGKPNYAALSNYQGKEIEIVSSGTTVDRIKSAAEEEAAARQEETNQDPVTTEPEEPVEHDEYEQEKAFIASLDGWWAQLGGLGSGTASGYRAVRYIQDGVVYEYDGDGNLRKEVTIDPSNVERHDEGIGNIPDPGWFIYDLEKAYVKDSDPNTIICINVDGSSYSGTSSYGRIDGEPDW